MSDRDELIRTLAEAEPGGVVTDNWERVYGAQADAILARWQLLGMNPPCEVQRVWHSHNFARIFDNVYRCSECGDKEWNNGSQTLSAGKATYVATSRD